MMTYLLTATNDDIDLPNTSVHDYTEISDREKKGTYELHIFTEISPRSFFEASIDYCKVNFNIYTSASF